MYPPDSTCTPHTFHGSRLPTTPTRLDRSRTAEFPSRATIPRDESAVLEGRRRRRDARARGEVRRDVRAAFERVRARSRARGDGERDAEDDDDEGATVDIDRMRARMMRECARPRARPRAMERLTTRATTTTQTRANDGAGQGANEAKDATRVDGTRVTCEWGANGSFLGRGGRC